jgi:hypothetical protein
VRSGLGGAKSSSYQQMPVSIQNGPRLRRRCLRRRQGKRLVEQKSAAVTRLSEISGRRAFERASVPETLAAVIKDNPDLPTEWPPSLARIVRRCLRMDPARRFQNMADVTLDLQGHARRD